MYAFRAKQECMAVVVACALAALLESLIDFTGKQMSLHALNAFVGSMQTRAGHHSARIVLVDSLWLFEGKIYVCAAKREASLLKDRPCAPSAVQVNFNGI